MVDVKLPASGNIRIWFVATNGFANWESPTAPEINAGLDLSDGVSWNDFDFGLSSSGTTSDPAITAKGNVQDRGASVYGGSLSFYYPGAFGDNTNKYSLIWDALRLPGTEGYLVIRVDGEELTTTTGTTSNPGTTAGAGDIVNVYRVETAGYADQIVGEEAFRYTVTFLPKGQLSANAVVRATSAAPTVTLTPTSMTLAAGAKGVITATVTGRSYTRGVRWNSSNTAIATVSRNGVISRVVGGPTGTVSITATDPKTNTTSTAATITAS